MGSYKLPIAGKLFHNVAFLKTLEPANSITEVIMQKTEFSMQDYCILILVT